MIGALWIFLAAVLLFIAAGLVSIPKSDEKERGFWGDVVYKARYEDTVALLAVFGAILLIADVVLCIVFSIVVPYKEQPPQTIPIIACQDNLGIEGNFYYHRGSIDTYDYYFVFYPTAKGDAQWHFRADMTFKQETNEKDPCVEIYRKKTENEFYNWLLGQSSQDDYFILYIPVGSTKNEFNVDLQ